MKTAATAAIELQADGLNVRLSFSCKRSEFPTLLAEHPISDARQSEDRCRAEVAGARWASAAAPGLLQAFEQAQSVVQSSLGLHLQKQHDELRAAHGTGKEGGFARPGLINTLGALALIAVLALGTALDGPQDHQADWADSQELKALQTAQADTARRQVAAQTLCTKERGPNSEARFTAEGHLVCTTRRGLVAVQL